MSELASLAQKIQDENARAQKVALMAFSPKRAQLILDAAVAAHLGEPKTDTRIQVIVVADRFTITPLQRDGQGAAIGYASGEVLAVAYRDSLIIPIVTTLVRELMK